MYLRAFNRELSYWDKAALVIVLDNDKRDTAQFRKQLENMAIQNKIQIDHVFCIAIKEMEAWLLGDLNAIEAAYPQVRKTYIRSYTQDGICDTWEVLANMIYPGGLTALKNVLVERIWKSVKQKASGPQKSVSTLTLQTTNPPASNILSTH